MSRRPERGQWLREHRRCSRGEEGQALVEQSILLAALVCALAGTGTWLARAHPELLHAIDAQVRSAYFVLSLPVP